MSLDKGQNGQVSSEVRLSLIGHASQIARSYIHSNRLAAAELPNMINSVHAVILNLYMGEAIYEASSQKPSRQSFRRATSDQIADSIRPDYLISFENGVGYKSLKQHLKNSGLDFEQYKEKWGLPSDYPSCSASYSERRSQIARETGLGGKRLSTRTGAAAG